jgi:plastocyanin
MKRLLAVTAISAVAATTGLACGGEEDRPAPAAAAGGVTIDMKDIKYVPEQATAKVGQTVTWTNSDSVAHTVTKADGPGEDFDSGTIAAGKTYEQKFTEAGTVSYVCTIHPNQTGSIDVR